MRDQQQDGRRLGRSEGLPVEEGSGGTVEVDPDSEVPGTAGFILPADEPPKSGEWVETDDVVAAITAEEAAEGQRLGETIDTEDDDDNGLPGEEAGS